MILWWYYDINYVFKMSQFYFVSILHFVRILLYTVHWSLSSVFSMIFLINAEATSLFIWTVVYSYGSQYHHVNKFMDI